MKNVIPFSKKKLALEEHEVKKAQAAENLARKVLRVAFLIHVKHQNMHAAMTIKTALSALGDDMGDLLPGSSK